MNRQIIDFSKDEHIINVYNCAKEVYGHGIAIPSNYHPCGWDWIDFESVEDILEHKFEGFDISNGCGNPAYEGDTLKQILLKTEGKFAFEVNVNNIDWYKD